MDEHLWSRLYDSSIAMKLPESCPLNPNKELFYKQEKNKLCKHTGECSCQLCGKSFKNEFYMDKHLTLKHHDVVNHNATICLADFCPIFGCSYHRTKESTTRKRDVAIDDKKSFNVIEPCTEESLATRKHQCEQLLSSCFPSQSVAASLNAFFKSQVCESISCVNGIFKSPLFDSQSSDWSLVFEVLRWAGLIGILFFIIVYGSMQNLFVLSSSSSSSSWMKPQRSNFFQKIWRSLEEYFSSTDKKKR